MAAPVLLLLDEPSLGLAPKVAKRVFEAIEEIGNQTSVLLVEQNAALALRVCKRAYILSAGEIVLAGGQKELSTKRDSG